MTPACFIFLGAGDNSKKFAWFANLLREVLPNNEPHVMSRAARVLGRIAQVGGTISGTIVGGARFVFSFGEGVCLCLCALFIFFLGGVGGGSE